MNGLLNIMTRSATPTLLLSVTVWGQKQDCNQRHGRVYLNESTYTSEQRAVQQLAH